MNKASDFARNVYRGKTIGRILFNWEVSEHCADVSGHIIDLAGGEGASYYRYFPKGLQVTRTNWKAGPDVDQVIDLNKPLPFPSKSADVLFLFNALYIIDDQVALMKEMRRVLKPGGKVYLSMPFISPEIPEPHDYVRLTREGIERLAREGGFASCEIHPYGERFSSAAYLLHPFFLFNTMRLIAYALALGLDRCVPGRLRRSNPCPIGSFAILS